MCGIALILSQANLINTHLYSPSYSPQSSEVLEHHGDRQEVLEVGDLKVALQRRGPDSFGEKKVFIKIKQNECVSSDDANGKNVSHDLHASFGEHLENCMQENQERGSVAELYFLGATLQLRGTNRIIQPLVDSSGNLLVYNGEIFDGINIAYSRNDAEVLLNVLEGCCLCRCDSLEDDCSCSSNGVQTISGVLSTIRGPWALIYWQKRTRTLWFGRDALGRRSLLVHWPTCVDPRFILSSVSPASAVASGLGMDYSEPESDATVASKIFEDHYYDELPCGICSIRFKASEVGGHLETKAVIGEVRNHKWTDPLLSRLIKWDRMFFDPKMHWNKAEREDILVEDPKCNTVPSGGTQLAEKVLSALRASVMRRTVLDRLSQLPQDGKEDHAPIALLFSGGLDSMILAALLDQCLDAKYAIDLLNVSFDGQLAPDRVSARSGVVELQRISPQRRWRLVEIDASLTNLTCEALHLASLIHPSKTYMDLNIGLALWLAAGGDGCVDAELCGLHGSLHRYHYKSTARILLVGSGADEQCAGYGRHRTKYRLGGWSALNEEMRLDMHRIWKRNMGRDDRCISDQGKEARFPFLDEDVIKTLLDIPLWEIAELDLPIGRGDKKILREVSRLLGLEQVATLPKRAIQFGSRIARESNRRNFGSNRAANQASAGSVKIHLDNTDK